MPLGAADVRPGAPRDLHRTTRVLPHGDADIERRDRQLRVMVAFVRRAAERSGRSVGARSCERSARLV